jgi:hypothetical protein
LPHLKKLEFSPQIFEESLNAKFHENPSSGARIVPCLHTDGRTDMTKLIFACRNFSKAHKNFYRLKLAKDKHLKIYIYKHTLDMTKTLPLLLLNLLLTAVTIRDWDTQQTTVYGRALVTPLRQTFLRLPPTFQRRRGIHHPTGLLITCRYHCLMLPVCEMIHKS